MRYPLRIAKQVTAQTPSSALSSCRPFQTVGRPISRGYSVRGSTAAQPTGSPPR
ncbi:MAG: hypothetical protein WAK28_18910 [Trebonia sp.]